MKTAHFCNQRNEKVGRVIHLHDRNGDLRGTVAYAIHPETGAIHYGTSVVSLSDLEHAKEFRFLYNERGHVTRRQGTRLAKSRCFNSLFAKPGDSVVNWGAAQVSNGGKSYAASLTPFMRAGLTKQGKVATKGEFKDALYHIMTTLWGPAYNDKRGNARISYRNIFDD